MTCTFNYTLNCLYGSMIGCVLFLGFALYTCWSCYWPLLIIIALTVSLALAGEC